jgi:hypothetical protein
VKRTGKDERIVVVIHIFIETTQGSFLCRYFYLKLAKTACFSFCLFSSTKLENRRAGGMGIGTRGRGQVVESGRRMNAVEIMYTTCM